MSTSNSVVVGFCQCLIMHTDGGVRYRERVLAMCHLGPDKVPDFIYEYMHLSIPDHDRYRRKKLGLPDS